MPGHDNELLRGWASLMKQVGWEWSRQLEIRIQRVRTTQGRHATRKLQLDEFLKGVMPPGWEHIPWWRSALILVVARLCHPSSELFVFEQWYPKSALPELLGVPADQVDDNRLYRTLDQLLPHKEKLEIHLKNRMGELFDLEYDLLMYDITSTYFEGQANFDLAQRGYSRDKRSDCKQVCMGPVVPRCGGYEVFAGNTADVTTVEHIVETMEKRYGKSDRIWVMDRGMVSEDNIDFLRDGGRRYIVGTPKSMLKKVEEELGDLRMMDVILPTRSGIDIRKRCLSKPTDHQQILLDHLKLRLPKINQTQMV